MRNAYVTHHKSMPGKKRKIGTVDLDTGEVLEGVSVFCHKKRNPYPEGWVMNSQFAAVFVAKDKEIKGETHRVLWYLLGVLSWENWIVIPTVHIAKELEIKRPQVSRAMSLLEKKGIIIRGEKVGRYYAFRLNPEFGWKGDTDKLSEANDDLECSEYIEAKLNHLVENGLGEHTGKLRIINGGLNTEEHRQKLNAQARKYRAWVKKYRLAVYGQKEGIEWEKLTTEEVIKLYDEAAEREKQLRASGEWQQLMNEQRP